MRKDKVVSEILGEELAVTPSDLYNTEFKTNLFGGYDKNEVDMFLERVGDVFESLLGQLRDQKETNEGLQGEIESARAMESTLRDALVSAQRFSESALDSARREADAITAEAREIRERARLESANLPDALRHEIDQLATERGRLRADIESILRTHAELLERIPSAEETALTMRPSKDDEDHDDSERGVLPGPQGPIALERDPWEDEDEVAPAAEREEEETQA